MKAENAQYAQYTKVYRKSQAVMPLATTIAGAGKQPTEK
jgi:hypothetical protein